MKRSVSPEAKIVVYQATNRVNGKRYIGITSRSLQTRSREHLYAARCGSTAWFHAAIRKHGFHAFDFSVLATCIGPATGNAEEQRFIALFKPEYNRTAGGDGQCGRVLSEEARRAIGLAARKRRYPGRVRTESERENLRRIGLANKKKREEFARLGPLSMQRRVICLDDRREFVSTKAAAEFYQVSRSAFNELCLGRRGRKTVGGKRFAFVASV